MNSDNKWHDIWGNKEVKETLDGKTEFEAFSILKEADGFDVAVNDRDKYYRGFYDEFLRLYDHLMEICDGAINSIYEVGCGSGVNLYMFKNRISGVKLGGLDYSEKLLSNAASLAGGGDFSAVSADNMSEEPKYDVVMSEGVFEYFESEEYASTVLQKMIKKSDKATCIMGVYDKEHEKELMDHKRSIIPDYDKKYEGLPKRFYSREWFEMHAKDAGKKVEFTKPDNPEYWNAAFQYNVYIF